MFARFFRGKQHPGGNLICPGQGLRPAYFQKLPPGPFQADIIGPAAGGAVLFRGHFCPCFLLSKTISFVLFFIVFVNRIMLTKKFAVLIFRAMGRPSSNIQRAQTGLRLRRDVYKLAQHQALDEGVPVSDLVERAMIQYLQQAGVAIPAAPPGESNPE
jgi:hypothetical protein